MEANLRAVVDNFDAWQRHRQGVFEFDQNPECLLRLQLSQAIHDLHLPGLSLQAGDPILLIHLWNERLRHASERGTDLGWARPMLSRFISSLRLVAGYIAEVPQCRSVRAVGGITVLAGSNNEGENHLLQRLGFEVISHPRHLGAFGEFWENFYSWLIMWAYNPDSLRTKSLWGLRRMEFWMPIEEFKKRYQPK